MNNDFEPVMKALFAHLVGAAEIAFTGDATGGDAVLRNVSTTDGLFAGLPVFGPGVASGAMIQSIDAQNSTVTLTAAMGEDAAQAVYNTGFLTTGRRVKHWQQVQNQPALFLRRTGVTDESDHLFPVTTLECELWIYCNAGQDEELAPDEALTGLETLIRKSLAPDLTDDEGARFTLGRRVYWCRIEGRSDISAGDQDQQAIARLPLRVTLP